MSDGRCPGRPRRATEARNLGGALGVGGSVNARRHAAPPQPSHPPGWKETFTVPGHAVGYYTQGARPNWKRLKDYHAYMESVMSHARIADIRLPLHATEEHPVIISTRLYSTKRVHHDPENVQKACVDSLFYKAQGGDKHVGGRYEPATYDEGDRVVVTIEYR